MPLLIGIGAFVIGILIGSAGDGSSGTTAQPAAGGPIATVTAPGKTVTEAAKPGPTVTVTEAAKPGPTATVTEKASEPDAQDSAISDGQYEVGTDIKPGRWKTTTKAEENGSLCYADVQSGGDYLAQELTPKGYTIVSIPNKKGAIFTSKSCGDWKKIG